MGRRLDARGGEEEGGSGGGDTPFARSAVAKQSTAVDGERGVLGWATSKQHVANVAPLFLAQCA